MLALQFELQLEEPFLATTLEGDPNSAVSLPFIPGSALRGALVARYLRQHPGQDLATAAQPRTLFLNGETCFLNGYPLDNEVIFLPTPASFHCAKGESTPVYDLSVEPREDNAWEPQAVSAPFCQITDDQVLFYHPTKQINVHTQRDREKGRATTDSGAVFRYEALAAGQAFTGVILCATAANADLLEPLLQGELLLGGSHNAGYGRVRIGAVKRIVGWREVPAPQADIPPGGSLSLTLLSDAILRDTWGQPLPFVTAAWLSAQLGVPVIADPTRTFARTSIVGGFNRKWGLPLPQMPAARAGSVYTFTAQATVPVTQLAALLKAGIGERRAEGFGRLAINWHTEYDRLTYTENLPSKRRSAPTLTGLSAIQARRIAERLLRRNLEQKLLERVNTLTQRLDTRSFPANSQLSQISILIRSALPTGDLTKLEERLANMKKKAQDQFEKAQIENQSLLEWIREHIAGNPQQVWRWLFQTSFDSAELPGVGGVRAAWDDTLAREYALRLVDGVLHRVLTQRRRDER